MELDDLFNPLPSLSSSTATSPATSFASFDMSEWDDRGACFLNMDHIRSVEKEFCSDLICCAERFADLHHLLEHHEKRHVVAVSAHGKPLYPLRSKPRAFYMPDFNDQERSRLLPYTPNRNIKPASSHSLDPPTLTVAEPPDEEPESEPPELESLDTPAGPSAPVPPTQAPERTVRAIRTLRTTKTRRPRRPVAPEAPTKSEVDEVKREKAFRCPRPGCIKTYLNPNGLKYHIERGTCSIDPGYQPPALLSPLTDINELEPPFS